MFQVRELCPGESDHAALALLELRPHFASRADLVAQVDAQRASGYRVVASFENGAADAAAAAGFWIRESLAWGRFLYVDDLVTRQALRGRGHADAVMAWMVEEMRGQAALSCTSTRASGPSARMRTASTFATACGSAPTTSPASCREQAFRRRARSPRAQAGAASRAVMRRKCSKRSSISSRVRRLTRSVPNSCTLNEAITEP